MTGVTSKVVTATLVAIAALSATVRAQTGFTPAGAAAQRAIEAAAMEAIEPGALEAMTRTLAARPHVAGTAGQAALRDTLAAWLHAWGLAPTTPRYEVFLPHATHVSVALTAPESIAFELAEPPVAADPATLLDQYPWVNGYSAPGIAEAEVVYAGHGLHEDYALLDSLGIDVRGRVVVARYGRSYRGVKARLAAARGAAALVLYSDPQDDGYVQGDIYPAGPFRPWGGIQRGSVLDGVGDPSTPSGPSVSGAPRAPPAGGAPIPVVPVSYEVAGEILSRVGGGDLPREGWQGGLPFRYHVGPGPARLRVAVDDDRDGPARGRKEIANVVARIEGRELPDEWVILGAHIDAWGPGAGDNVSGTVSVWTAARAVARLAAEGRGPRRTVVVAGWDGEEWGLIGSTEWVEEHTAELLAKAVAYLNQDGIGGTRFGAAASPSLKPLLREAADAVPDGAGSLLASWGAESERDPPPIGDLGGGSDFAPFYNHLGIPSAGHGFGTPGGAYHSHYDTHRWMTEFGDPGFVHHALSAELLTVLTLRLANAEVLPFDYATMGEDLLDRWAPLGDTLAARAPDVDTEPLEESLRRFAVEGRRLARTRDEYLAGSVDSASSQAANRALLRVERELTRETGLVGRPWYKNLVVAADRRNGYATIAFPAVAEALAEGDAVRVGAEIEDLAARVERAAAMVAEATAALEESTSRRAARSPHLSWGARSPTRR